MKKVIIVLFALMVSAPANAWLCTAQSYNGAWGQGLSPFIFDAQQTALNYCYQSGGFNCQILYCQ